MNKSPYTDCSKCPLEKQQMVVGEASCESLMDIDLLIIAEAPSKHEVKAGRPLQPEGDTGRGFRKAFKESGLYKVNHFITNVCLCSNINEEGKTTNPPAKAVKCCSENLEQIIKLIKPKYILAMGGVVMKRLGIGTKGITDLRGEFYDYNGVPVMLTIHPRFFQLNGGLDSEPGKNFLSDLTLIKEKLIPVIEDDVELKTGAYGLKEPYHFKYPKWIFDSNIKLLNIQRFKDRGEVCFVFKDKNTNEKKYHYISDTDYYYYTNTVSFSNSPMIMECNEVYLTLEEPGGTKEQGQYESDIRTEIKHSVDYYYQRKKMEVDEANIPLKIMYWDIEVYSAGKKDFPDPKIAPSPINAISFKINDGPINVFIAKIDGIENKKNPKCPDGVDVKWFEDERSLLVAFYKEVCKIDPDVMTGWNVVGFDFPTLFNRMKRNQISIKKISPIEKVYANLRRYNDFYIGGIACVDQLDLYKEFTYSVEENYKLNTIAQKTVKKGKVTYEGSLDKLFEEDIEQFMEYSYTDSELLYEIESELGHINLKDQLRKICSSTWEVSQTTTGLIDPLVLSYAKEQGIVCKDAVGLKCEDTIKGAYVRFPDPGIHTWLVDFDYTALYPSIICSCNIGPNSYVAKIPSEIAEIYIYNRQDKQIPPSFKIIYDPIKSTNKEATIDMEELVKIMGKGKYIMTITGSIFKSHDEDVSFLYKILRYILESREFYKNKMKEAKRAGDDSKFKYYKNVQLAYKILANSLYGVLANSGFRFFSHDLAQAITLTGQEAIKFIGHHVGHYMKTGSKKINPAFMDDYDDQKIPYLCYTDTDSIFINMGEYLNDNNLL